MLTKKLSSKFRFLSTTTVQTVFVLIAFGLLAAAASTRIFTSGAYIITMAVVSNIIWFSALAVFPFIHVIQTGKFMEGILRSWLFNIFGVFFISIIIPGVLRATRPEMAGLIENSFPDSIGVFPVMVMGGLPAIVICGIAYGIRSIAHGIRSSAWKKKAIIPKDNVCVKETDKHKAQ